MSSTAYDYAPSANGSVDRSAASSQRRVRQQNTYRVFPRDHACAGGAPHATARALTENAACACGVRSIGRVDTTECASSAGPTTAGVQLIRCVNRAFRNSGASPDVSRRREADTDYRDAPPPPPRSLCPSCQCACAGLCAWACVCARACRKYLFVIICTSDNKLLEMISNTRYFITLY